MRNGDRRNFPSAAQYTPPEPRRAIADIVNWSQRSGSAGPTIALDKYGYVYGEAQEAQRQPEEDIYQRAVQQRMTVPEQAQSSDPELAWSCSASEVDNAERINTHQKVA